MSKLKPPAGHDDNPEWTETDFAAAQPASEVHPPHVAAALVKRKPGRPAGSLSATKEQVTLRLDVDVLAKFKATGPGWQTRMNDALRAAAKL
ncbi:MAG: BrnA antitoxin family protein [Sphingobium sp.]